MSKVNYLFVFSIIYILLANNVFANNWNIFLKDGNNIICQKLSLEKDSKIKYIDTFNIEKSININQIETIRRIFNQKYYDKLITLDTFYIGEIIEYLPKNFISIKLSNDSILFLPIEKVIEFKIETVQKTFDKAIEIGVALGYPAAVNLIIGYYYKNFGIRLSGSYIYLASGYELELKYKLFNDLSYNHYFKIVGGYSLIKKDKFGSQGILTPFSWKYLGLSYEIRLKGFFIDFGLSWGEGDYKQPNIIFKIGYSYLLEI